MLAAIENMGLVAVVVIAIFVASVLVAAMNGVVM